MSNEQELCILLLHGEYGQRENMQNKGAFYYQQRFLHMEIEHNWIKVALYLAVVT